MAKFCANCGNLLDDDDKFCGNCGAPVEDKPAATAAPQAGQGEKKEKKEAPAINLNLYSSLQKTARNPRKDRTLSEKYFSCQGRLNRKPYFWRSLALWLVCTFVGGILAVLFAPAGAVFAVILLISSLMLSIRRLHDLNKTGWFVLLNFIPVVNFFWGLYLLFAKGTIGPNDYGPDPLAAEENRFADF